MSQHDNIPKYVKHDGTCFVAGRSNPASVAQFAFRQHMANVWPLDFLIIGGNANQQAMKAMGLFCNKLKRATKDSVVATFFPIRFIVETKQSDGSLVEKEATAWRTIMVPYRKDLFEIPENKIGSGYSSRPEQID